MSPPLISISNQIMCVFFSSGEKGVNYSGYGCDMINISQICRL